ncbi:MAG: diguanylate cyclase [Alphaproteobacteria bacterium]|nr:diguanylate cyclase [Alphaproteobacteria bacterium]
MLFFTFFRGIFELLFGLSAFAFLGFATWYASSSLKYGKGLRDLWFGLFVFFLAAFFYQRNSFFVYYGVSADILVFLRLFLTIGASVLFLMASSHILLSKELPAHILFAFISAGLVLSLYAVFVAKNVEMEQNISLIVPMIGLAYLFLGFVSQPNLKHHLGLAIAGLVMFGFFEQMAFFTFLGLPFSYVFTLSLLFILAASYFLMEAEFCAFEKKEIKQNLEDFSDNVMNILKASPFPILISKLTDDTIVFANKNALKLFELDVSELSRYHFKDFFVDADNRKLLLEKLEHIKEVQDFEVLVKTSFGNTPFWLLASANVVNYRGSMVLYSAFQDITSRKLREKALQNQADRDPLTSIYNRRYFEESVSKKIENAHLRDKKFAVLMIDADHFKKVNDKYGHKTGDKVLMEMAHVLERSLRPDDVVARYGGEEFVAFLNDVDEDVAVTVAHRLKNAVSNAVVYSESGEPVSWTVSIGVAPSGISDEVSLMIKMADDAMYMAKQHGRNRVELYIAENFKDFENLSDRKDQYHPAFGEDEDEEISLLDGIETSHIIEE